MNGERGTKKGQTQFEQHNKYVIQSQPGQFEQAQSETKQNWVQYIISSPKRSQVYDVGQCVDVARIIYFGRFFISTNSIRANNRRCTQNAAACGAAPYCANTRFFQSEFH